jgi:hypothetical protein
VKKNAASAGECAVRGWLPIPINRKVSLTTVNLQNGFLCLLRFLFSFFVVFLSRSSCILLLSAYVLVRFFLLRHRFELFLLAIFFIYLSLVLFFSCFIFYLYCRLCVLELNVVDVLGLHRVFDFSLVLVVYWSCLGFVSSLSRSYFLFFFFMLLCLRFYLYFFF